MIVNSKSTGVLSLDQCFPDSIPVIGSKITEIYPKVFWNDLKILFSKTAFANYPDLNL